MTEIPFHLDADWLQHPDLQHLFSVLQSQGATARLVGGAVRDGLLGLDTGDLDLAINVPPEDTLRLLKNANITGKPTGIEHGTVTAILHKRPYQITTLRQDIETFGRHARVEFTEDWVEDAKRRDFTINALYANADGQIFDPCGGRADLEQGLVRFIGKAKDRIQEDYLRILRFFRFSARFSKHGLNKEGLEACHSYASQLHTLSLERITEEYFKIISLPQVYKTVKFMTSELEQIFDHPLDLKHFKILEDLENVIELKVCALRRTATLIENYNQIKLLKLPKRSEKYLKTLLTYNDPRITLNNLPHLLYIHGPELVESLLLLQYVREKESDISLLKQHLEIIQDWDKPTFPLKGKDVLKLGVPKGEAVGEILNQVEEWWINEGFTPSHTLCLKKAETYVEKVE